MAARSFSPPPTRFGPSASAGPGVAQRAPMGRAHAPPPTRYGGGPAASAVAQPAAGGRTSLPPPPSRFSPPPPQNRPLAAKGPPTAAVVQPKVGFEFEMGNFRTERGGWTTWYPHPKGSVLYEGTGYKLTTDESGDATNLELIVTEIDENNQGEVNAMLQAVRTAQAQISNLATETQGAWVRGNAIACFNGRGSRWDRIKFNGDDVGYIPGQLQMTVGRTVGELVEDISGERAERFAVAHGGNPGIMGHYQEKPYDDAMRQARVEVDGRFGGINGLGGADRKQLAAIVAYLANIPLNARFGSPPYPKAATGALLARTDMATIVGLMSQNIRDRLTGQSLKALVVATVRHFIETITEDSPVYPSDAFQDKPIPDMSSLSIGRWITALLPSGPSYWRTPGKDLLTKAGFPGTKNQRNALESMGAFGSRTDSGSKPVVEFRSLTFSDLGDLETNIQSCLDYLRR